MPTIPPETIAVLAASGRLFYIVCGKCGHFSSADFGKLAQQHGWNAPTKRVERSLYCQKCNYKEAKITEERPYRGESVCGRCGRPFVTRRSRKVKSKVSRL